MAAQAKKAVSKAEKPRAQKNATTTSGAGPAIAERSKDAKPAPKPSKSTKSDAASANTKPAAKSAPAKTAKPASRAKAPSAEAKPAKQRSMAGTVIHKVKKTATGALALAASVVGKGEKSDKPAKTK